MLHPCYILHQRPYRETSLILNVLSREYGKLSLVAKGAKRGKVNQRPLMQINQKLNIAWIMRGEMGTLTTIEAEGINYNFKGKILIAAYYLNELIMRLLHEHEPHPELFDAYDTALKQLKQQVNEQSVLRVFEKRLLDSLGYGLVLDHDVVSGEPIEQDKMYYYQIDFGHTSNPSEKYNHIKISGATLTALAHESINEKCQLTEAKQLTRQSLLSHLGSRPLASRELFRAYLNAKQIN